MKKTLLVHCLLFLLPSVAAAETYFVAPDGEDAGPGSAARPWRTLHRAAAEARAGDTVRIAGGVYPISRPIRPARSGTPDAPIVFRADPTDPAIIDAFGLTEVPGDSSFYKWGAVHVEGVSHLRLENLQVREARNVGFMIRGKDTRHIDLIGCRTDGSYGSGVGLWYAQHVRVMGCEIVGANNQELRRPGQAMRREAPHEALTVAGARHFEVAFNHIHHGMKEGVDVKEVSAHGVVHHNHVHTMKRQGLYVDSWFGTLEDVEFHSNLVHHSEWGMAVAAEGKDSQMRNIRIRDNVFHDNRGSGIFFSVWGHDRPRTGIRVHNNTIFRNGSPGHWAGSVGGIDLRSASVRDVDVFNNVVFDNHSFEIGTFDSSTAGEALAERDIRIFRNLSGSLKSIHHDGLYASMHGTLGQDAVVGDPRLVNPDAGDFRLQAGSPAIDAAAAESPAGPGRHLGAVQRVRAEPFEPQP